MIDPYIDDKTGVLKNKLNITTTEELNKAEADIGFIRLINIDDIDIEAFDDILIKKIHSHIFHDIFSWAGEYRKVPLIKEEVVIPGCTVDYSHYNNINNDLKKQLDEINKIEWKNLDSRQVAELFSRKIALLWRVHPFRDGNTRTMLSFSYLFAKEHGFSFDIETFTLGLDRIYNDDGTISKYSIRDKFVLACLDEEDYPEVGPLATVFENAIKKYNIEDKKSHKK